MCNAYIELTNLERYYPTNIPIMKFQHLILLSFLLVSFHAKSSVEVMGSLKQSQKTQPGAIVKGEIRIQNNDATDQEVRVYQTDLLYNLKEQVYYDTPVTHARSNAKWIDYSPKSVILKAKETRNIEYTITIPSGDSIKGTYWSVIMVEGVSPIDPTQTGDLNIRTVTRYAVQIVSEIENRGIGSLKFMEPTLIKGEGNSLFLAVDILNDGEHYIAPEISMELFDEAGNSVKTITAPKKGLYPTTSSRFRLDLEGIPSKKTYKAMIVAAGTDEDVFGLEYTLYF